MENQYYTPKIEDISIGYEGEIAIHSNSIFLEQKLKNEDITWIPFISDNKFMVYNFKLDNFIEQIRTPYLTQEQIEKEGWKIRMESSDIIFFDKDKLELEFRPQEKNISMGEDLYYPKYNGFCPSINEFRKIMKLLNIK